MDTKEITDSASIFKMIDSLYKQFPVYIILSGKPKQVKLITITPQGVLIQAPDENPDPAERALVLTNAGNLLVFIFKVTTKDPRGIELLFPISLSIKTAVRASNRFQATKVPLYFSNFISQSMIIRDLSDDTMKVEAISKPYIQKLKAKFTEVIFYIHERLDARAKILAETNKNIFVPDYKNQASVTDAFLPYFECASLLKSVKDSGRFLSEICIPLKYKSKFPIGYIQILHEEIIDINDYNLTLLVANTICKEILESEIYNDSKIPAEIMDISATGFSISHPQSKYFGKIFSIGGTVLFDIHEEKENIGTFRAIVRNIKPLEKLFRIGCQFFYQQNEAKFLEDLIIKYFPESAKEVELKPVEVDKIRKAEKAIE